MAKNRLPTATLQRPQLPEPNFEPAPYADMTPVPGYSEVPLVPPDRLAAIGGLSSPDFQSRPWDSMPTEPWSAVAEEQVRRLPLPGGLSPRASQLQSEFQDIRGRGMEAADLEATQKRAALENWLQQGGMSPSGRVYRSPTGREPIPVASPLTQAFSATTQAASGGGSSYVPGGISQPQSNRTGVASAIQTGDPFFDVNIDFDRLAKEKLLKDNNDAAFSQANDARLGGIAADRQRADAARAAALSGQGLTEDEIKRRMFPQRFAQPKDPAIANAQAIDAAERQGRSNLHAIAQKFRRNGLPLEQAYAAAMNTIKTTNPADMGAVPSLPGMDPMRIASSVSPGAGMAAGNYGVGLARAGNELTMNNQNSADRRYEADARERVGSGANQNNLISSLIEMALANRKQNMNEGVVKDEQGAAQRQQDIDMMNMLINSGAANMPPSDPRRQMYDQIQGRLFGASQPQAPAAAPQPAQAPLSSAMGAAPAPAPAPAGGGTDYAYYASNPAAMEQYLRGVDPNRQAYERARIMAMAGNYNDPYIADYAKGQFANAPNLEWWFDNEAEPLAKWASQQPGGLPYEAYLPAARQYRGL